MAGAVEPRPLAWAVIDRPVGAQGRLRLCAPEVATVNSSLECVGSSSKEKPTVTRASTVALL